MQVRCVYAMQVESNDFLNIVDVHFNVCVNIHKRQCAQSLVAHGIYLNLLYLFYFIIARLESVKTRNSVRNHFGSSLAIIALQWHSQEVEAGGIEGEARIDDAKRPRIEDEAPNRGRSPRFSGGRGLGRGLGEPPPQTILENSYLKPCNLVYSWGENLSFKFSVADSWIYQTWVLIRRGSGVAKMLRLGANSVWSSPLLLWEIGVNWGRSPNRGGEAPENWGQSLIQERSPRLSGRRSLGRRLGEPLPRKFLKFILENVKSMPI